MYLLNVYQWLTLFLQEYILKGVVNAALGQEIGSVSISVQRAHASTHTMAQCDS